MAAKYAGFVLQSMAATLDEVLEARTLIEPPLAAALAERSDRKQSARALRKYIQEHTLTPDDPAAYVVEFHGFNRLLMSLTGNDAIVLVTAMLESIADVVTIKTQHLTISRSFELHERVIRTRLKLADLIERGDAAATEHLWRVHLTEAAKEIAGGAGPQVVDVLD
jgi:DNA-binding FadR family transcriptional regulator